MNVQVDAMIFKEYTGLSDDEMLHALMFDIRFQCALHTISFNGRSLGRFRERCNAYEKEIGIDLLHDTIISFSGEMAEMMKPDLSFKRMDSLMGASNTKKMSRLPVGLSPKVAAIMPGQASTRLPSAGASANNARIKGGAAPNSSNAHAERPYPQRQSGVLNSRDTVG